MEVRKRGWDRARSGLRGSNILSFLDHEVVTKCDIPANTELTISYGKKSNDSLLQYYSFYVSSNPHDTYILKGIGEWNSEVLDGKGDFNNIRMGTWIVDRKGVEGGCERL